MATTHIDYRKIDYDQLLDKPIIRTDASVDTLTTAGVYDKGDGKRYIVSVNGQNITQVIEEKDGYQTRSSTDGGTTWGAWETVEFSKSGDIDAEDVNYDNTTSELQATNVQAAIDEIDTSVDDVKGDITDIQTDITNIEGDITNIQGDITEIKNIIEVETMPTPSEDAEGTIIQYKGATTASFTHGYFYECVGDGQDPETFSWVRIDVQPSGSGDDQVVYLTQAEYDALPSSKLTDGKIYKIKTSGSVPTPVSISDTLMFNVGTVQCLSSDNEMYIIPSKQALKRGTMEKINATASYGPGAIVGNYFYVKNSSSSPTIAKIDLGTLETETITITGITATNIKQIFGEWDYLYFVDTTSDKVWGYSLNTQEVTLLNDQLDLNNVEFVKNGILYNLEGDVLVGYDTNNNFEIADRIPFYNGVPLLSGNDIYAVISEGNGSTNGLNVIQKVYTFNS